MISKELSATLGFAVREAKKRRHEYVSIEHILFAILYDPTGIDIVENCGGNVENLIIAIEDFFEEKIERIPAGNEYVLQQTIGFQRVIQRAVNHARSAEKPEVTVSDILASIFLEKDSHAEFFLSAEGVTRLDVLNFISHMFPEPLMRNPQTNRQSLLMKSARKRRIHWNSLRRISLNLPPRESWTRLSAARPKWNELCKFFAAVAKIIRFILVIRESEKRPWPKDWPRGYKVETSPSC